MKQYRHIHTKEIVFEEDAVEYVLDELGVTIEPKGENGEMTVEQLEHIESTVEWYFSGNWIEEDYIEKDEEEYDLEMIDRIYENNLERKWDL